MTSARHKWPEFTGSSSDAPAFDESSTEPVARRTNASAPVQNESDDASDDSTFAWSISTGAHEPIESDATQPTHCVGGLAFAADPKGPSAKIGVNTTGKKTGYNPYDSGRLAKSGDRQGKRDLRRLAEWLSLRKQAKNNRQDD